MTIEIYTGAACSGYSHSGGCAALLTDAWNDKEIARVSKGYHQTTWERMNIMAIILGLRAAESFKNVEEIKVFSPYWKVERHFRFSDEPGTVDLWKELDTEISKLEKKGTNVVLKRAYVTWYAHDPLFHEVFHLADDICNDKDKHDIDSVFDAHYKAQQAEANKEMPKVKAKKVEIYTVGGLDDIFKTKGSGGCAAILVDAQTKEEIARVFKGYRKTKDWWMEIKAIIWGLLYAKNLEEVEEIKIFPRVYPINYCIFKYAPNTVPEQSTVTSSDEAQSWMNEKPWSSLVDSLRELERKGIRISIVQLMKDDEWTYFGTREQQMNYNNVIRFYREARDRSNDLIDPDFEPEDGAA